MTFEGYPGSEGEYEDKTQVVLAVETQHKIVTGYMITDMSAFASASMEQLFGVNQQQADV